MVALVVVWIGAAGTVAASVAVGLDGRIAAGLPAPVTLITRLRLDAALYEPAPARAAAQKGRPRRKGRRLPTLAKRLTEPDTTWSRVRVRWYGGTWRWLEVASDTAVWYHSGPPPVALR